MEVRIELGRHFIVDLLGCKSEKLQYVDDVQPVLLESARISEATILNHSFHQFEPVGVSGVILIAESHFSIHTWPEERYVSFDILTCGEMLPEKGIDYLAEQFGAEEKVVNILSRGVP